MDSGVLWKGEIPVHCGIRRLKYPAPRRVSRLSFRSDDDIYVGLEDIESWTGRLLTHDIDESVEGAVGRFIAGDELFDNLRPYLGKAVRPKFGGVSFIEIIALRPIEYSQGYLFYSF